MHWGMIRVSCLLALAGGSIFSTPVAQSSDAARLSGTYQVIHKSEVGGQAEVQVQIHLANRGPRDLHIQRVTFWDLSHPAKGGTQSCSLVLPSSGSADTTQQFTVSLAEYELWRRGTRPRLVLEIAVPHGHPTTEVVHLDRISSGKVN
jgi:hypothetical protein